MKVQFIVSVATVLLSAVPSAFAAEPVLRGTILASDSFLDKKSGEKGGSGKQKSGKDRKGGKDDKDRKYKGRKDYKDWYKKDRKGNECWDRTADKCDKHKSCATFEDKKRGLLFCAPKNFDSKRKGGRKYFKGKEKDVSFAAKKITLDRKTVRRLCKGHKYFKGKEKDVSFAAKKITLDRKTVRRLCGKKMESEDYYDFEVESDYDSGDSSEDSFVAKGSNDIKKWFGRRGGKNWYKGGKKGRHVRCYNLSRSACDRSKRCTLVTRGKKRSDHVCLPKKYYYDFEEESPSYDSEDSSYSEDFEDEDLFDSEDFSEDFDSEDFDSEDFDSEDFDFDYEDFDSEDFE